MHALFRIVLDGRLAVLEIFRQNAGRQHRLELLVAEPGEEFVIVPGQHLVEHPRPLGPGFGQLVQPSDFARAELGRGRQENFLVVDPGGGKLAQILPLLLHVGFFKGVDYRLLVLGDDAVRHGFWSMVTVISAVPSPTLIFRIAMGPRPPAIQQQLVEFQMDLADAGLDQLPSFQRPRPTLGSGCVPVQSLVRACGQTRPNTCGSSASTSPKTAAATEATPINQTRILFHRLMSGSGAVPES